MYIPDRFRHASVVAVTSMLTQQRRVAVRTRLLSALQASKSRDADILVLCHPKAGSTWFRVMLSRLYQVHYGLPPRRIVKSDEFCSRDPRLPRFLVTNGFYTYEAATQAVLDAPDASQARTRKKILLARDPCDVAVSWYLQFTNRTRAYKRELINSTLENPVDSDDISMWDFVMHDGIGLPAIIRLYNLWQQRLRHDSTPLIIRYEDLLSDAVATLSRVVDFLRAPFTAEEIAHAVEFAAFDNMRKLEQTAYFRNSSMKPRNYKNANARKVRSGKVGGFRDHFAPEQVTIMEDMVRERLSPALGYSVPRRFRSYPVPQQIPVLACRDSDRREPRFTLRQS